MSDVVSVVAAFQREYEAELQVAFDQLAEIGWPPGRLILESGPIGVNRDYTILIKRGIEMAGDMPVFKVRTAIGGGALRYWAGWIIPPDRLPEPHADTIKRGELAEASWKRSTLADGWIEDERPISENSRETITNIPYHGRRVEVHAFDEWSNVSPARLAELAAKK